MNTTEPPDPFEVRDLLVAEQRLDIIASVLRDLLARGCSVPKLLAEVPTVSEAIVRRALDAA